ncbi:hypothetical protein DFH09DRAFT_1080315 [Mycena vulgaris]|nr:hypothetical protein DFH09DRAFT_1080315 [Mycena vulgaris]
MDEEHVAVIYKAEDVAIQVDSLPACHTENSKCGKHYRRTTVLATFVVFRRPAGDLGRIRPFPSCLHLNVATGMDIAALDLFYDLKLNAAVAVFHIFATQMVGYGIPGVLVRVTFLVYCIPLTDCSKDVQYDYIMSAPLDGGRFVPLN